MAYKYLWNLKGRTFIDYSTYRFPTTPHPHVQVFDEVLKQKIRDFIGKVLVIDELDHLVQWRMLARSYWERDDKIDTMKLLGITVDHLNLLDGLFDQLRKDVAEFIRDDLIVADDPSELANTHLLIDGMRAGLEYHIIAPFLPEDAMKPLRDTGVLHSEHVYT